METLLIQLTNHKALGLLHEMEALDLIKVLEENIPKKEKISEKYAGKLPSDVADELRKHIIQSRNEWNGLNV